MRSDVRRSEILLDELGTMARPATRFAMATKGTETMRRAMAYVSCRDAVDHDERVADERGLHCCRSAGNHAGPGMIKSRARVLDQRNPRRVGVGRTRRGC